MLREDSADSFLPDAYGQLVVQPVMDASRAAQVCTRVTTANPSFRVPVLVDDPSTGWVAEGGEITASDPDLDEEIVSPLKLAGLTVVSRELAEDSSPAVAELIGNGLGRDIARKLDVAYFGNTTVNGPDGIEAITANDVDAGAAWADLDCFLEAVYEAEAVGATLTAFVANPTDALLLAQLKESTGSNKNLLQPDPTAPARRMIAGVPLYVTPAVTVGTVWGIPADRALLVVREDVKLTVDKSRYFEFDSIGIRATMRVSWAFPHEAAVQRITVGEIS
jgi:HK97 family phage major capsid protein